MNHVQKTAIQTAGKIGKTKAKETLTGVERGPMQHLEEPLGAQPFQDARSLAQWAPGFGVDGIHQENQA